MNRKIILLAALLAILADGAFCDGLDGKNKINIRINGSDFSATLEDNDTARALAKRLPLEIEMKELNGNEKYYNFREVLPSSPTKVGTISAGDLMLYGGDCLVLFYGTFGTSYRYTRIGRIDEPQGLPGAAGSGNVMAAFSAKSE